MNIFAIADLHISGDRTKPMDVFGIHWENHFEKIKESWKKQVKQEDVVLIPGDISWAMMLETALEDLKEIHRLPGTKIMIKGNHDYWWSGIGKLRSLLPPSVFALQNDAVEMGEYVFSGSRGWTLPGTPGFSTDDEKIFNRELMRMEMSLQAAQKKNPSGKQIAMIHYPPFNDKQEDSPWTALFEKYGVSQVVYGHLHGGAIKTGFTGGRNGIDYFLVSCDSLNFNLKELPPI